VALGRSRLNQGGRQAFQIGIERGDPRSFLCLLGIGQFREVSLVDDRVRCIFGDERLIASHAQPGISSPASRNRLISTIASHPPHCPRLMWQSHLRERKGPMHLSSQKIELRQDTLPFRAKS
jgi:hypothetical protein